MKDTIIDRKDTIDRLESEARRRNLLQCHIDCYEVMTLEDFGDEIVLPFVEEVTGVSNDITTAKAYIERLIEIHRPEVLRARVETVDAFLNSLELPEYVRYDWEHLKSEICA